MMISDWQGVAYNQVPHSQNKIHGDKFAKEYGFKGGLVPGVTVSAYLIHPAAQAFGMDYVEKGFAHVRVNSPLYDSEEFHVQIDEQKEAGYSASLIRPEGKPSATAEVRIVYDLPSAPARRDDPVAGEDEPELEATPENLKRLMDHGCQAFVYRWNVEHDMGTYLRDRSLMAVPFAEEGYANPSFVLGVSNWVLASNALMNPWVHMETRSQNFAAIPGGARVLGEMEITDLFNRKGHEFVDATINLFDFDADTCFASVNLRAIYRLRA